MHALLNKEYNNNPKKRKFIGSILSDTQLKERQQNKESLKVCLAFEVFRNNYLISTKKKMPKRST